jgi:hypothetical protein
MFTDVSKGSAAYFCKVEAAGSYEMLVYVHQSGRRLIPDRRTYGTAVCHYAWGRVCSLFYGAANSERRS